MKYKKLIIFAVLVVGILSFRTIWRNVKNDENAEHDHSQHAAEVDDHQDQCADEHGNETVDEHGNETVDEHGHQTGDAHANEIFVKLTDTAIKDFGIEVAKAQGGKIGISTTLPAEITLNADAVAHVVSRIPGVVRSVAKNLGDKVLAGDVLAVINSRELSDYKAAYLAAKEKLSLAQAMFQRENNLWKNKITAEQEFLNAKRDLADAQIELRSARQKLHALGFSQDYLENLSNQPDESFIIFEIVSPIAGTIIEKHITLGEMLKDDSQPFVVADLSNVWVKVNVHQKDLQSVKAGQKAFVKADYAQAESLVSYVSSVLDENTRTAFARIVLPNEDGIWRPGTFASASIFTQQADCDIVVPKDAVVTMENKNFVFVANEEGFSPQSVTLAAANDQFVEIDSGLNPGQMYVTKGAFTLKSEMTKSNEDPCGGH